LLVLTLLAFAAVTVRVGRLQLTDQTALIAEGEAARTQRQVLAADRGIILDRTGAELALSVPQTTYWADPKEIVDPAKTAAMLAGELGLDPTALTAMLTDDFGHTKRFVYIARQVADNVAGKLQPILQQMITDPITGKRVLQYPGIYSVAEPARFYPSGDSGRSVIGGTDIDGRGNSGIEKAFEDSLSGTPGELRREKDTAGRTIPVGQTDYVAPTPGDDLQLTIDRSLQFSVEQMLIDRVKTLKAKGGVVIVLAPKTGNVLAMASVVTPTPDPAAPAGTPPPEPRVSRANAATVYAYEPGSVNKVITAAAAVELNIAGADTLLDVPAQITRCDKTFKAHNQAAGTQLPLREIITESSNTGTINLAESIGAPRLDHFLRLFGLGAKTGLGLPDEAAGILPKPNSKGYTCTSLPTIAIGQGVSTTPMQMINVYATVANGGMYQPARLVQARLDSAGRHHDVPVDQPHRVVSPSTASSLTSMLEDVVSGASGTGHAAAIDGYQVAGKTGTAQKPQPNGTYLDDKGLPHYFATFVGYAPSRDPQAVVLAAIDDPATDKDHFYAAYAAAPLFHDVMQQAMRTLRVPPSPDIVAPKDSLSRPAAGDIADAGPAPSAPAATTATP
jgi:cell division protein FtsI (penicillin-binding protein 3)